MPIQPTTNFRDSNGVDLGKKLISKEYLMAVYPEIANQTITGPQMWVLGRNPDYMGINSNSSSFRCTPVTTFAGVSNWKSVFGGYTSFAIKTDGSLWGWGDSNANVLGQVGAYTSAGVKLTPVPVTFGSASWASTKWKQVVGTGSLIPNTIPEFCMAWGITDDDKLWTWGSNYTVANGANVASFNGYFTTPQQIYGGGTWRSITCVPDTNPSAFGIKTDGTLWVWGYNIDGVLGTNDGGSFGGGGANMRSTPVTTFAGGNNWEQISAGGATIAAIKTDGSLWTWGNQGGGSQPGGGLGTNDLIPRSTPVTTFAGGNDWKYVCAGNNMCAAIKTDGTLWVWGSNTYGQLGINAAGASAVRCTPVTTFAGGNNWKYVACVGGNATGDGATSQMYAIKTDGSFWAWGRNHRGQLGTNQAYGNNSSLGMRCTPVTTFAGGTNWKFVIPMGSTGGGFIAIRSTDS